MAEPYSSEPKKVFAVVYMNDYGFDGIITIFDNFQAAKDYITYWIDKDQKLKDTKWKPFPRDFESNFKHYEHYSVDFIFIKEYDVYSDFHLNMIWEPSTNG